LNKPIPKPTKLRPLPNLTALSLALPLNVGKHQLCNALLALSLAYLTHISALKNASKASGPSTNFSIN